MMCRPLRPWVRLLRSWTSTTAGASFARISSTLRCTWTSRPKKRTSTTRVWRYRTYSAACTNKLNKSRRRRWALALAVRFLTYFWVLLWYGCIRKEWFGGYKCLVITRFLHALNPNDTNLLQPRKARGRRNWSQPRSKRWCKRSLTQLISVLSKCYKVWKAKIQVLLVIEIIFQNWQKLSIGKLQANEEGLNIGTRDIIWFCEVIRRPLQYWIIFAWYDRIPFPILLHTTINFCGNNLIYIII